jgi:hypothetical protein
MWTQCSHNVHVHNVHARTEKYESRLMQKPTQNPASMKLPIVHTMMQMTLLTQYSCNSKARGKRKAGAVGDLFRC